VSDLRRSGGAISEHHRTLSGGASSERHSLPPNIFDPETRRIWKAISARFASNTSGEVFAFVEGADTGSIFTTVEEPILRERGIKINYMPESPCG